MTTARFLRPTSETTWDLILDGNIITEITEVTRRPYYGRPETTYFYTGCTTQLGWPTAVAAARAFADNLQAAVNE